MTNSTNKQDLSQDLSIMALFDPRAKLKITHNIEDIFNLAKFTVLSTNYRKIKKYFNFKYHNEFFNYLKESNLCFAITEVAFTHLDVDKSFLDILKPTCGEEFVENYKKQPSAIIMLDEKLKIHSHLIICRNIIKNT